MRHYFLLKSHLDMANEHMRQVYEVAGKIEAILLTGTNAKKKRDNSKWKKRNAEIRASVIA
ncbi:MAG: hypothetical protein BGP13_21855 [Sphingobacteriales bacterium 40-81]|nr:MAG: hypothetical protein BGP13_21855 [Sphingobacteriales bacterium 40-81]